VVPDTWTVEVDTIPDEVSVDRPAALPSGSESRRKVIDWGIVAVVAAALAVVTALGSWIQLARRPARPTEPAFDTRRYRGDPGDHSPLRKAAIGIVSLEQSLASQLLSHLDRSAIERVTWEIARLDRVDPAERAAVLAEFYGLGLRRLCFVFDDLVKVSDADI